MKEKTKTETEKLNKILKISLFCAPCRALRQALWRNQQMQLWINKLVSAFVDFFIKITNIIHNLKWYSTLPRKSTEIRIIQKLVAGWNALSSVSRPNGSLCVACPTFAYTNTRKSWRDLNTRELLTQPHKGRVCLWNSTSVFTHITFVRTLQAGSSAEM